MLKSPRNNLKTPDSNLNRIVRAHSLVCALTSLYLCNPNYILYHEVHEGEDNISQTRIGQDLALQQGDLAPTHRVFNVPHRNVDPESMQRRAKLQSALRRVMELERRLGAMHDNHDRFLRRERIQLGLEISVGDRGASASGFPFMMVLALIIVIFSGAYKYYTFSA